MRSSHKQRGKNNLINKLEYFPIPILQVLFLSFIMPLYSRITIVRKEWKMWLIWKGNEACVIQGQLSFIYTECLSNRKVFCMQLTLNSKTVLDVHIHFSKQQAGTSVRIFLNSIFLCCWSTQDTERKVHSLRGKILDYLLFEV